MAGLPPSMDAAKAQAKALRAGLAADGREIGHGKALDLVARSHGYKDWNTLHAAIGNAPRPPVAVGQIVEGRYLKQPFLGEVTGLTALSSGRWQVVLEFDQPVDVVTFDSFSNFRSRVTKVVGSDGVSLETTSDGVPHLVLTL
ncbi:MAG: glyoxalase superfamily protein [Pseudorhodobacter sp.]|nr:glyoxalase superfamily protein [Pseudorhodobacter sp.]